MIMSDQDWAIRSRSLTTAAVTFTLQSGSSASRIERNGVRSMRAIHSPGSTPRSTMAFPGGIDRLEVMKKGLPPAGDTTRVGDEPQP